MNRPDRTQIRSRVRGLIARLGWDVRRTENVEQLRRKRWFDAAIEKWRCVAWYCPRTILDIGANTGQFAGLIRNVFPEAKIISFEPLHDCCEQLAALRESLAPFEVIQTALGDVEAMALMNRNAFSPSSSLLEMESLHSEELPETSEVTQEEVQIKRLDDVVSAIDIEYPLIVKIDVQGFEEQVLLGGEETIKSAVAVVVEISSYPLYRGEATFDRIYELMRGWGFKYRGNVDRWISHRDGRILQFDALFENEGLVEDSPHYQLPLATE